MNATYCTIAAGYAVVAVLLWREYRAVQRQKQRTREAQRRLGLEIQRLEDMER